MVLWCYQDNDEDKLAADREKLRDQEGKFDYEAGCRKCDRLGFRV